MGTKSVDQMIVERISSILEEIFVRDFPGKGGQRRMAKAIGISPSQISNLINRKPGVGVGLPVAIAIRNYTGRSLDDLLGLATATRDASTPEPGPDAGIAEVLAFYPGRWDGIGLDFDVLAAAEGSPPLGWRKTLDAIKEDIQARLHATDDASPRPAGSRKARGSTPADRRPR